jgi:hypothetical protein
MQIERSVQCRSTTSNRTWCTAEVICTLSLAYIIRFIASTASGTPIFSAIPSVHVPAVLRCRSMVRSSPWPAAFPAAAPTREPAVGDRDHNFLRSRSFKKEGAVSSAGNIRPGLPEMNCDRDKSDPVARDRHKESRPRAP